jgi:hypothetical protein
MGPAKLQKAEKLGIRIVSEDEFLEMINSNETEQGSGEQSSEPVPVNVPVPVESPSKGDAPIQLSLF